MKVTIDQKKSTLTIEVPLNNPPAPSGSGKTLLLASTRGGVKSDATFDGKEVVINLNAYVYATEKKMNKAA